MRIFHISDLHFGGDRSPPKYPTPSAHYFAEKGKTPKPEVLAEILRKAAENRRPDVIVASGDIGWSGSEDDYNYAFKFVETLRTAVDVPFVFCAGNHDVDWTPSTPPPARQDNFVSFLRMVHGSEFSSLYPLFAASSDARRTQISSLLRLPDKRLTLLTVNSAANEEPPPKQCPTCNQEPAVIAPILVDPKILAQWEPRLPASSDSDLRILVVHHHLLPFAERIWGNTDDSDHPPDRADPTIVANSGGLQAWLARNHFSVVLHGHKHHAHARHDVLWRRTDPEHGREILVLGAGSAGVAEDERKGEPLSFYVLECHPLRKRAYSIAVETALIERQDVHYRAIPDKPKFVRIVGPQPTTTPAVFQAETMGECYEAIRSASTRTTPPPVFSNFLSIVDLAKFDIPPRATLLGSSVTIEQIENSFFTLHPEYDRTRGWPEIAEIQRTLGTLPNRYRFQHGTRLFAYPIAPPGGRTLDWIKPLETALNSLRDHNSRAFVGLYNPFLDATEDPAGRSPPPCLTGIQFIPDVATHTLHLIATFRKLELSFWWIVNMYEMIKILNHAVEKSQTFKTPGRISFFASLAEWKSQGPGATFSAQLDDLNASDAVALLLAVDRGDKIARHRLADTLREKHSFLNEDNIDELGISRLADLSAGVIAARTGDANTLPPTLPALLRVVEQGLADARRADRIERVRQLVKDAKDGLSKAITVLST